jgi:hypothetical protein
MSGWQHVWAHMIGPAPWYIWAIRMFLLLAPLWLICASVRRRRQGRRGRGQMAIWSAGIWSVFVLGHAKFLWPHHSRGFWIAFAVEMLLGIPWIVWGAGWVVPSNLREEKEWKAERRRRREAEAVG